MKTNSFVLRSIVAILLLIGFYILAIGIIIFLLSIPYLEWIAGRINIKLTFFCLAGAVLTFWAILPRVDRFNAPGPKMSVSEYPQLFKEINDIAKSTGQVMPKDVYLLHEANAWVMQRGGFMGIGSRRVMGLGLPLFKILTVPELKSIIAHEFGHYYSGDTKLGPWIYRTRSSIFRTIEALSIHSSVLQQPFISYFKLFMKVTSAISRAQEYTADRLAVKICGTENFISGLRKVYFYGSAYQQYWESEVLKVINMKFLPQITYGFDMFIENSGLKNQFGKDLDENVENSDPQKHIYDSHPSLFERINAVKEMRDEKNNHNEKSEKLALTILDQDIVLLERSLISALLIKGSINEFKDLSWDHVGQKVYLIEWKSWIKRYSMPLMGIKTVDIINLTTDSQEFFKKLSLSLGNKTSTNELVAISIQLIGAALSILLVHNQFEIEALPGKDIMLSKGTLNIFPFKLFNQFEDGYIKPDEWKTLCEEAGIDQYELGQAIMM